MDFHLNLILTLVDNISGSLKKVTTSIEEVVDNTRSMDNSLKNMEGVASLTSLAYSAKETGEAFVSMGNNIAGALTGLVSNVVSVGSEFESLGITLQQLYGTADEANKQIDKLLNFSAKTPFEVDDVKDLIVVLKSQGIEAFDTLSGEVSGLEQETLAWLGDLMAFKPDISAQRWRLAFTNFLGSGAPKVLQNALDMGGITDVIGHEIGDTAEERMQSLVEFIEKKDLGGLMQSMFGTWEQTVANMDDTITMLYRDIGNTGAFDNFKEALTTFANTLIELDEEGKIQQLAVVVGDALDPIAKGLIAASKVAKRFITLLVDFANTHPKLVKMLTLFSTIFAVITVGGGKALIYLSKFAYALNTFRQLKEAGMFVKVFTRNLFGLVAVLGILYLAWRSDFLGIRTLLTDFAENVSTSFNNARDAVGKSTNDMMAYFNSLDKNSFFDRLTASFMKIIVFIEALSDAWSDGEMDYELYQKAVDLGIIDFISRILDAKYRIEEFVDGFKRGWKSVSAAVSGFVESVSSTLANSPFFQWLMNNTGLGAHLKVIGNAIKGFITLLSSGSLEDWNKAGEVLGKITPIIISLVGAYMMLKGIKKVVSPITELLSKGKKAKEAKSAVDGLSSSASSFAKNAAGLLMAAGAMWLLADAAVKLATAGAPAIAIMAGMAVAMVAIIAITSKFSQQLDEAKFGLLAIGAMFIMVGVGMQFMANAAIALSDSGTGAMVMFGIMMVALIALTAVVGSFGDKISAATPGLLAIAAVIGAVALAAFAVGAAFLMAGTAIAIVASVLPQITEYGGDAAIVFAELGAGLIAFAGGLGVAAGAATLAIVPFAGLAIPLGSVAKSSKKMATAFMNTNTAILQSAAGIKVMVAGMKALSSQPNTVATSFENMAARIVVAMQKAVAVVQMGVLAMKSATNFQWSLPKLKMPHITVTGKFNVEPPSAPKFNVSWYKTGGVFDKPSVIGVGENGSEAVVPLENNNKWIGNVAGQISKNLESGNTINNIQNITNDSSTARGSIVPNVTTTNATNNSTTNNSTGRVDNSVNFNQGAINIQLNGTSDGDIKSLAQKIMAEIVRQKQIQDTMNYGINYAVAGG